MRRQWHSTTPMLQETNSDRQRTMSGNVSNQLKDSILLLVKHGDQPVRQYIYGETETLKRAGRQAGFDVKPLDDAPELPDGSLYGAHPIIPWRSRLNKVSNMEKLRSDIMETKRGVESIMPNDSWVSINLRNPGIFEAQHIRNWVASEHNNVEDGDELVRSGSMCARISVGATTKQDALETAKSVGRSVNPLMSDIAAHESNPKMMGWIVGLIVTILEAVLSAFSPLDWWMVLAPVLLMVITVLVLMVVRVVTNADLISQSLAVTVPLILLTGLNVLPMPIWSALIPLVVTIGLFIRWMRRDRWDDIYQKPRRYYGFQPSRRAESADNETPLGKDENKKNVVGYPVQRSTLVLTPTTVMAMWTPAGLATAKTQALHPVPEVLTQGGIPLGLDQSNREGFLDTQTLYGGISIVGEAGSGKSGLIHGIMQWADLHRSDTAPEDWGKDTRVIDFAMKDSDGVRIMQAYRKRHADKCKPGLVSFIADPHTRTIDLLGMLDGKDARLTGQQIAESMKYSFDPGDIMNDSLDVITSAMTIAVAVSRVPDQNMIVERVHRLEQKYPGAANLTLQKSPIGWGVVALAASDGQTGSARALGQVVRDMSVEYQNNENQDLARDLMQAARAAEQLYGRPDAKGHVTITNQRLLDMTKSSRNKVKQLMDVEHVFTPQRATITWQQVLNRPGDYHFVFAPVNETMRLPERMNKILGAWMMKRLWETIQSTCQGWQAKNKHTMLVCDELSLLANADDTALSGVREQGRSYGVIPVFATQYPQQLSDKLLESFMGYATFITFNTPNPEVAEKAAALLSDNLGEDGWTNGAVRNLPRFCAAVRTRTKQQLQPAFLVHVHDFDRKE